MKIQRTYPQPDSPEPHLGARERALAVFKYLLDLEPEQAVKHPLFPCIEHSYQQAQLRGYAVCQATPEYAGLALVMQPSLVGLLTGTRDVTLPETPIEDAGL